MKKINHILILILLMSNVLIAQRKVSASIHQDTRLGLLGDDLGNKVGTLDVLLRLKLQGNQQELGYMVVFPELEYAEIKGIYKRYSANIGYTFNDLMLRDFEASVYGGFGFIDRWNKSFFSSSVSGELAYKLNKTFKVSAIAQLTDRKDLKWRYGNSKIRFSGFIGLDINLN